MSRIELILVSHSDGMPFTGPGLTGYEFRSAKSSMRMASGLTMMKGNITKKPRARTSQGVLVRASNTAVKGRPLFFAMYS